MQHIREVYDKNPELLSNLLDKDVDITTKIDGTAFQVSVSEDNKIEFRKRSGNSNKLGPIIDNYTRLFVGNYENAMEHIESIADIIKENYKFLTFEIFKDNLILLSAITKDGQFIDSKLDNIANKLNVKVVPTIFSGKLNDKLKASITSVIADNTVLKTTTFDKFICDIFSIENPEEYMIDSNLEGIVFNFKVGDKLAQYKLVDPSFAQKHKDMRAKSKELDEKLKPFKQQLVDIINKWLEDNGQKYSEDKIESLDKNFLNMIKSAKRYNELVLIVSNIPSGEMSIQNNRLSSEIAEAINKKGFLLQKLYEFFIRTYYKTKSRNYTTDKETQEKINSIIEKL